MKKITMKNGIIYAGLMLPTLTCKTYMESSVKSKGILPACPMESYHAQCCCPPETKVVQSKPYLIYHLVVYTFRRQISYPDVLGVSDVVKVKSTFPWKPQLIRSCDGKLLRCQPVNFCASHIYELPSNFFAVRLAQSSRLPIFCFFFPLGMIQYLVLREKFAAISFFCLR